MSLCNQAGLGGRAGMSQRPVSSGLSTSLLGLLCHFQWSLPNDFKSKGHFLQLRNLALRFGGGGALLGEEGGKEEIEALCPFNHRVEWGGGVETEPCKTGGRAGGASLQAASHSWLPSSFSWPRPALRNPGRLTCSTIHLATWLQLTIFKGEREREKERGAEAAQLI